MDLLEQIENVELAEHSNFTLIEILMIKCLFVSILCSQTTWNMMCHICLSVCLESWM